MSGGDQATIKVKELQIGMSAPTALYDETGVMMVGRGILLTRLLVEKLQRRGITTLYTSPAGAAVGPGGESGESESTEQSASKTSSGERSGSASRRSHWASPEDEPSPRLKSPAEQAASPGEEAPAEQEASPGEETLPEELAAYSAEKVRRLEAIHAQSLKTVQRLAEAVQQHEPIEVMDTDPVIEATIDELVDDPDPVVAGTLKYKADLDLAERCLQFSTLCLAVGITMNFSPMALRDLGRAALLHDYGLFHLPAESRFPHYAMDDRARRAYRQHPLVVEKLMQSVRGATFTLGVLVAQVHELIDGSGFPRSLSGRTIHPLARVLSLVDAYLALTSPPAGHPRVVPCDAIAYLISGVSRGLFAPTAATGLLKTVTLYPIGSVVELSDTTRVRVIRSQGRDYGYPVVKPIRPPGEPIDLKESDLFVTRPIRSLESREVWLPHGYSKITRTTNSQAGDFL